MGTYADHTLRGSQPAAGRARSFAPCAGQSAAAAHQAWLLSINTQATKPVTRMFTTVPDSNGHRRMKRSP